MCILCDFYAVAFTMSGRLQWKGATQDGYVTHCGFIHCVRNSASTLRINIKLHNAMFGSVVLPVRYVSLCLRFFC